MKRIYLVAGIGGWVVLLLFIIVGITTSSTSENQIDAERRTFQMHEVVTHAVSDNESIAVKITEANIILDSKTPQTCVFGDCVDDRKPGKYVLNVMMDITNLASEKYRNNPYQFEIEDVDGKRYDLASRDLRFGAPAMSKGESSSTQIAYDVDVPQSQYKLILKQSWSDTETAIELDKLQKFRPELCQGDTDCFAGFVDSVVDGNTLNVLDIEAGQVKRVELSLIDTADVGEANYENARDFTAGFCPVKSYVLFDEDDGQAGDSEDKMIGKLFCEGKLVHTNLLEHGLAVINTELCEISEYAQETWAKNNGCS